MVGADRDDRTAEERTGLEIDRRRVLGAHPLVRRGLRIGAFREIDADQRLLDVAVDELVRAAVDVDDPQVAGSDLLAGGDQAFFEQVEIELTAQLHVLRHVDRHFGMQLLRQPQPELRCGEWERSGGHTPLPGRRLPHAGRSIILTRTNSCSCVVSLMSIARH
ncbi:hypothetical protein GCM10009855_08410 [Gordonia cholesterolivorans]|uniref:Uncharacterized protein n=1 Tax=Gordonia cholesterolivorans TaxID=559625 RepID=A0ABN3H7M3_9ACTN